MPSAPCVGSSPAPASAWETWEWSPDVGDDYGVEDAPPSPAPALVAGNDSPIAPNTDVHHEWLRRAAVVPRPAPVTPERLAEIIARLRASSPPSQPDDTPQPAPEQTLSTHSVRDVIAPQKPVQPAHEQTIATVISRIEIARAEIRYTKRETLNRETGELVEKATKAMKHRVRAIVSDVPDALFDAAWKKANDVWLTYRMANEFTPLH